MRLEREALYGGKPWPEKYTFVPAVRVGNTICISGTTGTDEKGFEMQGRV